MDPHGGFVPGPFRPVPWLPGPHAQTMGGKWLRLRSPRLRRGPKDSSGLHARHRLELPDGDFVDLDLGPDVDAPSRAPLVVLLHGLEGSSRRGYVRLAAAELARRGIAPVALNFRSCSGEPNRLPRFYHSGDTADLAQVIGWLASRFPGRPLGALGFSLGGNVLLKALAEGEPRLRAAAVISVPFDLARGTEALESSAMGRLYTQYFLRSLLRKVRAKASLMPSTIDLDAVHRSHTLREFDDRITAPLHGFRDADEYYRASSSGPLLADVRTPTLVLHACDDPFLPADALPRQVLEAHPFLLPAVEARGGHVGFVASGAGGAPDFWAEAEAARYLAHLLLPGDQGRADAPVLGGPPPARPDPSNRACQ
jgi:uncharacterized protein